MMSAGPWKPIRLEIYESRIDEIHFAVTVSEDLTSASVNYNITIESATSDAMVRVTLYKPQGKKTINDKTTSLYSTTVPIENGVVKGTFKIDKPELWYPIHYGTQALYTIIVDLSDDDTLVDTKHQNLAFRRARVVQQKLKDTKGTSFYFEINNIPIFCSGSNWIPADTMLTRLTCKRYREWLTLVIRGNQNMIRVWGGGIYEHDCFYDIADELGILIWQDFQFACGQYPCHSTFLENVERETITQIKRLRRHPSVVLFAGNNEDYQLAEMTPLEYDPMDLNPEHWLTTTFPARYIYEKILPELVAKHAPGVFYHPGSPWGNGKPTTDPTVGDIHQWNGNLFKSLLNNTSLARKSKTISIIPLSVRTIYF
jgi:beta-mannosidase